MYMLKTILLLSVLVLCSKSQLKIGVLIPGSANDFGWNWQIRESVQDLQALYPNQIVTAYTENVTVPNCISTGQEYINNGFDVLFFPNTPFVDCAKNLSLTYPNKYFITLNSGEVYSGFPNLAAIVNLGIYEARFIQGVLAAKQKDTDKVCFMAPKTYPFLRRWANIILLGMRHVNSTDELHIGLTGGFDHPPTETVVANHFLQYGCDVIMQHQNSITAQLVVANGSKWGIGWGSDMRQHVGESVLTSLVTDWTVPFSYYVDKILAGTFTSELFTSNLTNEGLIIAPYSSEVTRNARARATEVKRKLLAGNLSPLCGDILVEVFGTRCATEAQLNSQYLPGITVFDGTVA